MMKSHTFMFVALAALALSGTAEAACYADYKAKQNNPLRLHYGIIEIADAFCADQTDPQGEVARRLAAENWTLLNILSIFGDEGLNNRKTSAGEFFLRF